MAHVYRDHAEAAGFEEGRRLGKTGDGGFDQLLRHLPVFPSGGGDAVHGAIDGAPRGAGGVGVKPGVAQLCRGHAAVAADAVGKHVESMVVARVVRPDHVLPEQAVHAVHTAVAQTDGSGAAPGLFFIKGHTLGGGAVFGIQAPPGHGGGKNAVAEPLFTQPDGSEQMGIGTLIHGRLLCPVMISYIILYRGGEGL